MTRNLAKYKLWSLRRPELKSLLTRLFVHGLFVTQGSYFEHSADCKWKSPRKGSGCALATGPFSRDDLGLTGTKIGCDTSQCGACVVSMDGKTIKSCTCLAVQANGSDITTIEGVAPDGVLDPVQEAFWDNHGLQCGYCTAGMIITTVELLKKNPNPSDDEVREGLKGNICRCTGYQNIVKSVQAAAKVNRS
ncbi:MAG: hypothetical protein Ct9H300mP11_23510 [Chloroflexota bacterium]|nr:MAG: hypothetical protein Ct9H300mP11_23510 [Chloroflexota bacterium]